MFTRLMKLGIQAIQLHHMLYSIEIHQEDIISAWHLPEFREQTLKYRAILSVFNCHYELIRLHHIVLIHAGTHLKATKFAGKATPYGTTANTAQGHTIYLFAILRVIIVHVAAPILARHLPIVGGIPVEKCGKEREREME